MRFFYRVMFFTFVLALVIVPLAKSDTVGDDQVSIVILESGEDTTVSESGSSDTYQIVLGAEPTAPVTVQLVDATSPTLVTVDLAELQFTPLDWFTPQTVTVSPVDDQQSDGKVAHLTSLVHTAVSDDTRYQVLAAVTTAVWVEDDDCGSWGYLPGDTNFDCRIDIQDLMAMAQQWLKCTLPNDPQCQ
jgi:hypothetical protein